MAYDTQEEAELSADYHNHCHGRDMTAYNCRKCGLWHLAPRGSGVTNDKCLFCMGSDGSQKTTYPTREAAERQAEHTRRATGLKLTAYRCPVGTGYHLTRKP